MNAPSDAPVVFPPPDLPMDEIVKALEEGRDDDALALFDDHLEEHPHDLVGKTALASLLFDHFDEPEAALELLDEVHAACVAYESSSEDEEDELAGLFYEVAALMRDCQFVLGNYDAAQNFAQQCVDVVDDPDAVTALAEIQLTRGHSEEAIATLGPCLTDDPEAASAHFLRGRIAALTGDEDTAAPCFAKAAALDPDTFGEPPHLSSSDFAELVEAARAACPEPVKGILARSNLSVVATPKLLNGPKSLLPARVDSLRKPGEDADPDTVGGLTVTVVQRTVELLVDDADQLEQELVAALSDAILDHLGG